ncbi:MAG: D-glycero-beta-D-manno-heptose-7-phosphate kinase [Candidatus Marinimicrobia bacterium]|nr:D-glycero-beta-D-manno-heptose-7-phosphate kinase [Candidatus Neomarinimicrobiota bacterium]
MTSRKQQYLRSIEKFSHLKLLVIGDLMLDKYIQGSVSRLSPEAPVPVVKVLKKEDRIGGAGNVAANLAALNCNVSLAGICGEDENGRAIQEMLTQRSIKCEILFTPSKPTTVKTRIIAQHQQVVRVDEEDTHPFSEKMQHELLKNLYQSHKNFDGIILSDYKKGLLTPDFIQNIITRFPDIPVIVDPKGHDFTKYQSATVIKPNWKEFKTAINNPDLKIDKIATEARKMVAQLGLKGIIITLGEQGVFVLDEAGKEKLLPTIARDVFDVSGAGDTFIAAFTAGLLATGDWIFASSLANIASGIVVGKVGTAVVNRQELLDNLHFYY